MKQKQSLQQNIFTKSKQLFRVSGLPEVVILERSSLEGAVGAIELSDGTKVTGGRGEPADFTVTLHMSDPESLEAYLNWFEQCVDSGLYNQGVHPDYKRNAEIEFQRTFSRKIPASSFSESGDFANPVFVEIEGIWCMKYVIPEGNIDENDGDSSLKIECTLSYDDAAMKLKRNFKKASHTNNSFALDSSDQWQKTSRPNLVP